MEELSLNVSFASRLEIFDWEVGTTIRRLAGVDTIDSSLRALYVPVVAYLSSQWHLEIPDDFPEEQLNDFRRAVERSLDSLPFTKLLTMRAARTGDKIFDFLKAIPPPGFAEAAKQTWNAAAGNKQKIVRLVEETVYNQHVGPMIAKMPVAIRPSVLNYFETVPNDDRGGVFRNLLNSLPALQNHIEIMVTATQQLTRKDKINDFFDYEILPIPMAYASVFVSKDKGIRDILVNRTEMLKRTRCVYFSSLEEFDEWLQRK